MELLCWGFSFRKLARLRINLSPKPSSWQFPWMSFCGLTPVPGKAQLPEMSAVGVEWTQGSVHPLGPRPVLPELRWGHCPQVTSKLPRLKVAEAQLPVLPPKPVSWLPLSRRENVILAHVSHQESNSTCGLREGTDQDSGMRINWGKWYHVL